MLSGNSSQKLPKIRSLNKMSRAETSLIVASKANDEAHPIPKMRENSERRTLSSAMSTHTAKHQGNLLYARKIEELERVKQELDKQIEAVREEINRLRRRKLESSNCVDSQISRTTGSKVSTRDWKNSQNKLMAMHRRINKEQQKGRQIMMEVDAVRKEIVTLKKINLQLEEEKKIVDNKYATEILESQRYDQQIAVKNEQLQKKKIEGMHLKTETIKNYDNLLKKLEQELGQKTEGTNESRKEEFYLTGSQVPKARQGESWQNLKKINMQITYFQSRLQQYQAQSDQLKEKTNSADMQEVTRKFLEQYEENFHQYNFINEIYATLEGVKAENEELRRRKQGILDEIELKKTSRTYAESIRIHERIHEIGLAKDHLRQQLEEHKQRFQKYRLLVIDFFSKTQSEEAQVLLAGKKLPESVSESNLLDWLQLMLKLKNKSSKLETVKLESVQDEQEPVHIHPANEVPFDSMKKPPSDRLMTREELMQFKDDLRKGGRAIRTHHEPDKEV